MSEDSLIARDTPPRRPRLRALGNWRHSLLFTLLAASAASVALISALLFLGIDHFVTQRFSVLGAERLVQTEGQVRATVARELDALRNLAELLSKDAELNNATYYHLYLEGEIEHPVAAVRRSATAFHLDAARLWDANGRLVAAAPDATPPIAPPGELAQAASRVIWIDGQPWLSASAPLTRAGNTLALLWIGRPLSSILAATFPPGGGVHVRLTRPDTPPLGQRVQLTSQTDAPIWLDVQLDDSVERALAAVKQLLAWLLLGAGVLLAGLLGLTLRRQLAPLGRLTQAVAAVGRGEFAPVEDVRGDSEIARLVRAYNAMTADLAKLRELERQLQQQERLSAIGRMAARVAHDINNPLSVIRGVAELQARQSERAQDGAALADARLILHHIERCMRTVEHLLAYGKPIRLQLETLDLDAVCADITRRWHDHHPEVAIEFVPTEDTLRVRADVYQLERVLDNLLENARQAAPNGRIQVVLTLTGKQAEIRIIDSGPGFTAEAREHLFEPFHTTKRGGSGLGLASCLAIIQAHGGTMAVGDGPSGEVIVRLPAG
ncbi:MAG: sensor histidine kinase [Thiobacillus sp.]